MSIGTLGSAGDQFRDFLGGNQQDIGQGLQAVLSSYANPDGNFIRLDQRAHNMFQLNSSEHQSVFDHDAQNQFAETWYAEYRAVLLLRAEALKKKLNRAYSRIMENSVYAPIRPNEQYAPEANRDVNDIQADSPLNFYQGASVNGPPAPTNTVIPNDDFLHPDWFSGSSKKSAGNAYDDIRQYINLKYPLDDTDADNNKITYNQNNQSTPAYDGGYDVSSEQATPTQYYNLWDAGGLGFSNTVYDLATVTDTSPVWKDIAKNMNVPPSTTTTHFVLSGNPNQQYYIEIPPAGDSSTAGVAALLPTVVSANFDLGGGKFSVAKKAAMTALGVPFSETAPNSGQYVVDGGTKFYDPNVIPTQAMFQAGSTADSSTGAITGFNMNPQLVGPPGVNLAAKDVSTAAPGAFPAYQIGFVDSWYEARAAQKREAQVEAAYQAYLDGGSAINAYKTAKGKTPWTYDQIMDQVFTSIDTVGGGGGPLPPGAPPPVPAGTPTKGNTFNGLMPYGYYYFPDPSTPGALAIKHTPVNNVYQVGNDYTGTANTDPGSVYRLIYDRLAMAADPTGIPGGNSGAAGLSGSLPAPSGTVAFPATPLPAGSRGVVTNGTNPSHLYLPIPVGAAEVGGLGQPNINDPAGTAGLDDTTHQVPGQIISPPGGNSSMQMISNLFVGRQWDYSPGFDQGSNTTVQGTKDVAPVKYEAETISSHLMVLPGWFYDASSTDIVGKALVTLPPAIEGLAWQSVASNFGLGRIDDYVNSLMGGPFFQVGGGSDSLGIYDIDGSTTKYSIAVGFGMGIGGIYWGHTSAIGTIDRIEELMDNSGIDQGKPDSTGAGPFFQTMKASLQILAGFGGKPVGDMSVFPNVGLAGFHFDANIPIPIPPPVGLSFLNIPMTTYGSVSYDILTDYMYRYLDAMKHEVVDSLSAYSYATSGGYAMDSYGMRGEYHFTEKTAFESLKKMPDIFGFVPIADMLGSAVNLMGLSNYTVDNWDLKKEGILEGQSRHSFNAGEARELDTGAFFTAASFLTQFQVNNMQYSYWTETHQNEEAANMDTLRLLALTGKEMMKFLGKAIFGVAGNLKFDGPWATVTLSILNFMLKGFQESVNEALIWDLLLHDQDEKGFVTTIKVTQSSLKSEGYDFIEDERKLFAFDYEGGPKKGIMQKAISGGFGSFELPNQVLNGMANTRRYKPYLQGVDGRAGRQGWGSSNNTNTSPNPLGPQPAQAGLDRNHYLSRHAGDNSRYDDNWDIEVGFWQDTGLGDINEVYVRKNTVSYGGNALTPAIKNGLGAAGTPTVTTTVDRYVGSHNRIIGRGYDGAAPLNLQSFRTGYFSKKYFGGYITDTQGAADNKVVYGITGNVDGRTANITMHGGENYYDRKNDYQLTMTAADGTIVDLKRDSALAPTIGGNVKIGTVDMNNANQVFGASTQGETNPLIDTLYDYMRVKADGSNAQLVKEYRDVFNIGLLDDVFLTASANAATGGGVTSSIRLKFRSGLDAPTASPVNMATYETRREDEIVGTRTVTDSQGGTVTQNLSVEPGYLGRREYFKNTNRAVVDIYLSSFFAFKRQPKTPAK